MPVSHEDYHNMWEMWQRKNRELHDLHGLYSSVLQANAVLKYSNVELKTQIEKLKSEDRIIEETLKEL